MKKEETIECTACGKTAKFRPPSEEVLENGKLVLRVTFICEDGHVTVRKLDLK